MKEKLKIMKNKLRRWKMEVFGKVNLEVGVPVKELNDLNVLVAPNF